MKEEDLQADRPAIPSSSRNEEEARRGQSYDEEARKQDFGDADDFSREKWEGPRDVTPSAGKRSA